MRIICHLTSVRGCSVELWGPAFFMLATGHEPSVQTSVQIRHLCRSARTLQRGHLKDFGPPEGCYVLQQHKKKKCSASVPPDLTIPLKPLDETGHASAACYLGF